MHTAIINSEHLRLDAPLQFVSESFRTHGVHPSVVNTMLQMHKNSGKNFAVQNVYWTALAQNASEPNCLFPALIALPFLVRNDPTFDPTTTAVWPLAVAVFNTTLPTRRPRMKEGSARVVVNISASNGVAVEQTRRDDLHMHILGMLLCSPLCDRTKAALRADVFAHWNDARWSELFAVLSRWSAHSVFESDLKILANNIEQCAPTSVVDQWVQLACTAIQDNNPSVAHAISKRFALDIDQYLLSNLDIALAPHLLKTYEKSANRYKIWMVASWLGSHTPSIWENSKVGERIVQCTFNFLSTLHHGFSEQISPKDEVEIFKNSLEGAALRDVFKYMDDAIMRAHIEHMKSSEYANPLDALECALNLDFNIDALVPCFNGMDLSRHPKCWAHYQKHVLTTEVKASIEASSKREKKI
jgi:hypothetical protein